MRTTRPPARVPCGVGAVVAAVAVVAALASPPAQAAPSYDGRPVSQGAGWLTDQLTDGLVHNEQYDFDDVGLSIDVALGLHAAGKKPKVQKAVTRAVSKNIAFYVGDGDQGVYAGATAKAALLAQQQGRNPRSFGGIDLIALLEGRVATAAPIAGRIQDAYDPASEFGGDFANVIGQAYAAQALAAAGSAKTASVVSFLTQQQCADGYFRLGFTADKTAPDQSCDGAPRAQRTADTDATAVAAIALGSVKGAKAQRAVKKAVGWLRDVQGADGSFGGGRSTKDANTNSTGLAGWALAAAGAVKPAARAATWVRNLQVAPNPCAAGLSRHVGAIAYDATAYGAGQTSGIKKKTQDQWRRASAQALSVLRWAPRAEGSLSVRAPRTVAVGGRLRIALTGVAPGQRVCVVEKPRTSTFAAGVRAITQVSVLVIGDPGVRTFHVWVDGVRRDLTVRVTG